ncbi:hypothetical protein ACNI3K_12410 [Demequina sp. SO4-13]|uniref:hypothetical protein n=1 Tax=Demequina sp. SO4-13 TaxID=3401027 RepID=UPI003AF9DCF3
MSNTPAEAQHRKAATPSIKEQPLYTVPVVLAILMLSSGGFVLLLAQAIKIFSSIGY